MGDDIRPVHNVFCLCEYLYGKLLCCARGHDITGA